MNNPIKYLSILILVSSLLLVSCEYKKQTSTTETSEQSPPENAESSYSCSIRQGFNFEKDAQILVGHLDYLKIGDKELNADFRITDPEDVSNLKHVVGVLSSIYWKGGYADPVQLSAQVSTDNKNTIATMLHKTMFNTEVEFSFTVYDYDPKQKAYYKAFHSDNVKLKGLVLKSGGELAMHIDMDQSMEVVSPKNYVFTLGVMPQDIKQEIHLAVSVNDKFVKQWGIEVG